MQFDSAAQERCYAKLKEWLRDLYGRSATAHDGQPTFSVPVGRVGVVVGVQAAGDDEACIDLWTWPVGSEQLPPDAYRYMLETNSQYRFGSLNLQADGSALFEHVMMEEGVTQDTLQFMISMIASGADDIGAELQTRFVSPSSGS